MNEFNDAALVSRTRAGDPAAFGELVSRYETTARVVALKYIRDHHAAEDVVQQAFFRGYQQLASLRDPSKFSSWLMRIVQREACLYGRRNNSPIPERLEGHETEANGDTDTLDRKFQEAVELLNRLPEHERLVMSLHYLDGHSTAVISKMTGRPLGTVTKQLSRATRRIQSYAKRREGSHEYPR